MSARIAALACLWLTGCVLQAGAYGGAANMGGGDVHVSHGGELQTRVGGFGSDAIRFHAGLELDGRAEDDFGSAIFSGLHLTATLWPRHWVYTVLGVSYGMPAGWDNAVTGSYFGGTVEVPFTLFRRSDAAEINRNLRFVDAESALLPFLRLRRYSLTVVGERQKPGFELVGGIAIRTEIVTDLVDLKSLF